MRKGEGKIVQVYSEGERGTARLECSRELIPTPGQYLLAYALHEPDAPLAVPLFNAGTFADGFLIAQPLPPTWLPGTLLSIRGPLGHGFNLSRMALRIALVALDETPARLLSLLEASLAQDAAVTLVCDVPFSYLPVEVEIQPLSALSEVLTWADFMALDLSREDLPGLRRRLGLDPDTPVPINAQALVVTPIPCGGIGDCGVCAVTLKRGWKLACKDGPVFDLRDLI